MRRKNKDLFSNSSDNSSKKIKNRSKNSKNNIYSSTQSSNSRSKNKNLKSNKTSKDITMLIGKVIVCFVLISIIGMSVVITGMTVYVMKATDTPSDISLEQEDLANTGITEVFGTKSDGTSVSLAKISTGQKSIWVNINDVPDNVKNAFVAIEDKNFYKHEGVDFRRTFLAFLNMFLHFWNTEQGASTITQQLIKNITNDRDTNGLDGIQRKTREIYRAMSLERSYSKDQILQAYLNVIPVGGKNGNYIGIQAASILYYNKSIKDVTLAEAASLAAITNAPSVYDPINNPEKNKKRRDLTLDCMYQQGYINSGEYEQAVNTPIQTHKGIVAGNSNGKDYQSYFVDAALNQVVNDYMKKENMSKDKWDEANEIVKAKGFSIYTTIDPDMQEKLEAAYENPSTFGWKTFPSKTKSAFVVYDLKGNMKACVGGTGKKPPGDRPIKNLATSETRSPGSTMKPLAAYAPAVDKKLIGYSTTMEDSPIRKVDNKDWPQNYDKTYSGNIPIYYAVQKSLNTIPTKLVEQMGVQSVCDFLTKKLGMTTIADKDHPAENGNTESSGIAMGSLTNGITLAELTNAYQIFGNGGTFNSPTTYTEVKDSNGNTILKNTTTSSQAISGNTYSIMNRLLRNVITSGTGAAANLDKMGIEVVGKTGTSNDNQNLTFVGLTHDYVAGVWLGNDDRSELKGAPSPSNVWKNVMSSLLQGKKQDKFVVDTSVVH